MDAVVFDCDGVLVDSETRLVEIDQRMLADLGWHMTVEEVHARFVGKTAEHYLAEIRRNVPDLPANWRDPYLPLIERALREELEAIPGVQEVISGFSVPIAVASNSSRRRVRDSLRLVGLLRYFTGRIVSAEDVAEGKPAPDVYLRAAELLQVAPAACIAVEDSATGVRAARSAGMTVFGSVDGLTPAHTLQAAGARTFAAMEDLPGMLSELMPAGRRRE